MAAQIPNSTIGSPIEALRRRDIALVFYTDEGNEIEVTAEDCTEDEVRVDGFYANDTKVSGMTVMGWTQQHEYDVKYVEYDG